MPPAVQSWGSHEISVKSDVQSFCLNSFRICREEGKLAGECRTIEKVPAREPTLLQRVMVSRKRRSPTEPIPERTVLAI